MNEWSDPHFDMPSQPQAGDAPCPACFEDSGYHARIVPATWWEPAYAEPDPMRRCEECDGTGRVEMQDAEDEELFDYFEEATEAMLS